MNMQHGMNVSTYIIHNTYYLFSFENRIVSDETHIRCMTSILVLHTARELRHFVVTSILRSIKIIKKKRVTYRQNKPSVKTKYITISKLVKNAFC